MEIVSSAADKMDRDPPIQIVAIDFMEKLLWSFILPCDGHSGSGRV
jgi:hypothetical protein